MPARIERTLSEISRSDFAYIQTMVLMMEGQVANNAIVGRDVTYIPSGDPLLPDTRLVVIDRSFLDRGHSAVGFFGERRFGLTPANIDELNCADADLVQDLLSQPAEPDVLGYVSSPLGDRNNYRNLVLLRDADAAARWLENSNHQKVVKDLAPVIFSQIRIQNVKFPHGIRGQMEFEMTKHHEFDGSGLDN